MENKEFGIIMITTIISGEQRGADQGANDGGVYK